jgi:hypothetical protein
MEQDVKAFCKGCVLCNINKSSLLGKSELGTPRLVFQPFDNSKIRNQRNKQVKRTYHSYPPGTMILVRDNRPRAQRKMYPLYFKCPERVVSEYKCTVFSINFLGQVSKHSKNNIKLASLRSVRLFQELPDDIKLVLGEPFDAEKFSEIVRDKRVPEYLHGVVLDMEEGPRLR